jgi:hypothetical protein
MGRHFLAPVVRERDRRAPSLRASSEGQCTLDQSRAKVWVSTVGEDRFIAAKGHEVEDFIIALDGI